MCAVNSDTGCEGEVGTTARPELEKAAGFALEGRKRPDYHQHRQLPPGRLNYEFPGAGRGRQAVCSQVLMFNVEIGGGSATYTTAKGGVEFGAYSIPSGLWRSAEGL